MDLAGAAPKVWKERETGSVLSKSQGDNSRRSF